MEPPETNDLDYLLGVASPTAVPSVVPSTAAQPAIQAPQPPTPTTSLPLPPQSSLLVPPPTTTSEATPTDSPPSTNPKKRPLEDKKTREKKRILRNRELARVSNERRKGRIQAMENDLKETRQTVSTLEESIRCLEAENKELRNLLTTKPGADSDAAAATTSLHQGLETSLSADPSVPTVSAPIAPPSSQ